MDYKKIIADIFTVRGSIIPHNITIVEGDNNIIIQDVNKSTITISQNIGGIDEETFIKEIVDKITTQYPLFKTETPKELNTIFAAPPKKIIGRTNEVQHIMERLNKENSLLLVNGIGGIGKTVVASYYYSLFHHLYQHILWLNGSQNIEDALLFDLNLHESLGISSRLLLLLPQIQDPKKKFERQRALAIIETALKNLNPRTLVIIDNATTDNFKIIQKWQSTFKRFHLLITSRETNTNLNTYELGVLNSKDALDLFYIHYNFEKDDKLTTQILEQIHHHTLLIELVAKAGEEGSLPLIQLLEFLKTGYIEHEGLQYNIDINEIIEKRIPEEQRITNYIQLLFKTILKLDDDEQEVLSSLSIMPSQAHEKNLILQLLKGFKKKDNQELTKIQVINYLNSLYRKGYLKRHKGVYVIHSLVASATRGYILPMIDNRSLLTLNIALLLSSDQAKDDFTTKFEYITYGESLLKYLEIPNNNNHIKTYTFLQNELSILYKHIGDYLKSITLLENSLTLLVKFTPNDVAITIRQSNLALLYSELGLTSAKSMIELAFNTDLQFLGKNHPNTIIRQVNLGDIYRKCKLYTKSEKILKDALNSIEFVFGRNHSYYGICLSNLGVLYLEIEEYQFSVKCFEESLIIIKNNYKNEHIYIYQAQANLANAYSHLGNYTLATQFLEKAIINLQHKLHNKHPKVNIMKSNLGTMYRHLERYDEAIKSQEEALSNDILNFGEKHFTIANHQANLALMYLDIGNIDKGFQLLKSASENILFNHDKNHIDLARIYYLLGGVYLEKKDFDKAIFYWSKMKKIVLTHLGNRHEKYKLAKNSILYAKIQKTKIKLIQFFKESVQKSVSMLIYELTCFSNLSPNSLARSL